jgi:predicted hydrocarbon binding protein
MDTEIEGIIDSLWNSSLSRVSKKDVAEKRTTLGDFVNMSVPQGRELALLEANPALASLIYFAAYSSANRNAYIIMRKLNMPADYFWKYEFWPKERAFDTLQRVISRVFTAIMNQNKEGVLTLQDVDAEHQRFTINFVECAECAGITANQCFCYYHAGTFAGIIAGLMSIEMDGYETECLGSGQKACVFVVGKKDDPEIVKKVNDFLTPKQLSIQKSKDPHINLSMEQRQSLGNLVNIEYYQLLLTNSILSNPALFSASSFKVGVEYGSRLANIFKNISTGKPMDEVRNYYRQLQYLEMEVSESGTDKLIVLRECAEVAPALQKKELLGFLLGELQGLCTTLSGHSMICKESWFEGNVLKIKLSPQV